MLMAGANAVEVGSATFGDPRAPARVLTELTAWAQAHHVTDITELIGVAHVD
jgi:dihydroorotate dehydrogenase (NAD+) catalytic subunit